MKKVLNQILHWVMKYRKRIIYGAFALFIGQISFFNLGGIGIENEVFAAETQQQSDSLKAVITQKYQTLSFIQKIIYTIIYPILVIVGTLVDNSLVYGEVFNFDILLWSLWNMMRNLANFTLGFIFVYKIFKYLVGQKGEDIKKLLRGLLIAGVGIQASRFVMAALIDLSTILTYSVGGLPIYVLGNESTISKSETTTERWEENLNPYVLKTIVDIDVNKLDKMHTYLTNTNGENIYISECWTINTKNHELLIAPSMVYYKKNNIEIEKTISSGCVYGGQVYYFAPGYEAKNFFPENINDYEKAQTDYEQNLSNHIKNISKLSGDDLINKIKNGEILEQGNAHITGGVRSPLRTGIYQDNQLRGLDVNNEITGEGRTQKLQDILNDKSYVGVFTQLYSSLKAAGETMILKEGSEYTKFLGIVLALGHLLAISIPLIIVGVVFTIRIGILRIAIVISPFIALLTAFDDIGEKVFKKLEFLDYFKLSNLIPIIFSPAIICLAISLSTVLVTIISKWGAAGLETSDSTNILGGLIKLNLQGISTNVGRFVVAILGIAITRFLVWAAVETSKLGKKGIVPKLKELTESAIGSIPFIPVPTRGAEGVGVDFVGMNTAKSAASTITNEWKTEYGKQDTKAINSLLHGEDEKNKAKQNVQNEKIKTYTQGIMAYNITDPDNWKNVNITTKGENGEAVQTNFAGLEKEEQEKVIEAINNESEENRKNFGGTIQEIKVGDDKYKFDKNENLYKKTTS